MIVSISGRNRIACLCACVIALGYLEDLSGTRVKGVPSPSLRSTTSRDMWMDGCKSLNLLSELPPYLQYWGVLDCTSLEKVPFAYQIFISV
ncbi:TMV resistance protein N-like [Gossypium australe]|uniref:TMV resistance protein N-like n=1 Tax=Gossypium australe TaxID=47621 RepID=A0A5B6WLM9_9ROSI|nr:TMV resistance protein N-like [Gossypium australe]